VVDLDVLGFSGMELDRLLAAADAGLGDDADDAPLPPVVPVTRTGGWRHAAVGCADKDRRTP